MRLQAGDLVTVLNDPWGTLGVVVGMARANSDSRMPVSAFQPTYYVYFAGAGVAGPLFRSELDRVS